MEPFAAFRKELREISDSFYNQKIKFAGFNKNVLIGFDDLMEGYSYNNTIITKEIIETCMSSKGFGQIRH